MLRTIRRQPGGLREAYGRELCKPLQVACGFKPGSEVGLESCIVRSHCLRRPDKRAEALAILIRAASRARESLTGHKLPLDFKYYLSDLQSLEYPFEKGIDRWCFACKRMQF
jgi:hypothetical protein